MLGILPASDRSHAEAGQVTQVVFKCIRSSVMQFSPNLGCLKEPQFREPH